MDSVTYRNDDNGFAVIVLDYNGDPLTVVGPLGNVEEGEELELTGVFANHPKFGRQFKAAACSRSLPATASAIQRYLAGGVVKGIGPVTARAMVKKFGDSTLEILENDPEKLSEVEGVSLAKATAFSEEFKKVIGFRAVLTYFTKCNIPAVYGIRAWQKYGIKTLDLIDENPYILCGTKHRAALYKGGGNRKGKRNSAGQLQPPQCGHKIHIGPKIPFRAHLHSDGQACKRCKKLFGH